MSIVSDKTALALIQGKKMSLNNTTVYQEGNEWKMRLYNSIIATITTDRLGDKWLTVNACNYKTSTTKSRLNAVLSYFGKEVIIQRTGMWYLKRGTEIDKFDLNKDYTTRI